MEKVLFRDEDVVFLSKNFLSVRVDLTKRKPYQEDLIRVYRIVGVPALIFLDYKGKEIRGLRIESLVSKNELVGKMRAALEKKKANNVRSEE